jgi:hypothetical protein
MKQKQNNKNDFSFSCKEDELFYFNVRVYTKNTIMRRKEHFNFIVANIETNKMTKVNSLTAYRIQ